MSRVDGLALISGIDIPISEIQVNIHQPTIREIAYIGERSFYQSATLLIINKEKLLSNHDLNEQDKLALSNKSNFQILIDMLQNPIQKINMLMMFALLFPSCTIEIEERFIMLVNQKTKQTSFINEENFEHLQEVVAEILCLNNLSQEEFNPQGERARKIAEMIKKGRAKAKALNGGSDKDEGSFLSRYISGLAIGTNSIDMQSVLGFTLYQLFDQLERYGLYNAFNMSIQAKFAGAKDVEDVDWLKNIH